MSRAFVSWIAAAVVVCLGAGPAAAQTSASLSVFKVDSPDPVAAGSPLTYTITVSNEGPDDAANAALDDPLPAGTTFLSLASPAGWSCTTPSVGANGTVHCAIAAFPPGSAVFTLTVTVGSGVANGTVLSNTATVSSTTSDPDAQDNSSTADTTVVANPPVVVGVTKADSPDPVLTGQDLTYTITASNNGGGPLEAASLSDTLPANTTFVSLAVPAGWSCTTPAVGGTGTVSCSTAPFATGDSVFTLIVHVAQSVPGGTSLNNQATLVVTDSGRDTTFTASATTLVLSPAQVSATKTVSGSFQVGGAVTYTVVLTNASAHDQGDNPGPEFTDVLPPQLTLVSAAATSGSVVATTATNTVTWNGPLAAGASVTLTIQATIKSGTPIGTTITNQGTVAYDADGNGTNEATAPTDDPNVGGTADPTSFTLAAIPVTEIPVLGPAGLVLLALLLFGAGAIRLRRLDRA